MTLKDSDRIPTDGMASNARRGLELREKHGKGGTSVGVARARDIANKRKLSDETILAMHSFFSRHAGNEKGGEDDAGYIAWLLWGGDAGARWAETRRNAIKGETRMSQMDVISDQIRKAGMTAEQVYEPPEGDQMPGGLADERSPEDFDQGELQRGIAVEMEHTNNREIAMEIAMDHLTEDPDYYKKLEKMENEGVDTKAFSRYAARGGRVPGCNRTRSSRN